MSKIRRVVLYKHGVGHFERQAVVTDDAELKLTFRTEEMNDVLKSLTVFDQGGGMVSSVSYDNKKPVTKLLADISLDLPAQGGSVEVLAALRGAEVTVSVGSREVSGQVVGVDVRNSHNSGTVTQRHLLTIFDDRGRLQTFDFEELTNVGFLDKDLQEDMHFLFSTVFSAKKQDSKTLKIFSKGQGQRKLDISYVVECPVWKTSYRIALSAKDEPAYIQGWALVDNPQDDDWRQVELSLVSGLPISFRHDLYSPRYLERKEIAVATESAAGPIIAEGDLYGAEEGSLCESSMSFLEPPLAAAPAPRARGAMRASPLAQGLRGGSTQVETVTQKVGQLFEYKIDRPVTVLRNQSALVPIVSGSFEGGKLLLYNESERAENPYSVVDFKNTTGLTLEGGPVTVYEGEIYAGEAMLDTVAPGEERMLPYSVALDVEVTVKRDTSTKAVKLTVNRGVWLQKVAQYTVTTYRFINRGAEAKTVIVEHPLSDAELVNTPKPTSETRSNWRFTVKVEPDGLETLDVTEKSVKTHTVAFSGSNPSQITSLIEGAVDDVENHPLVLELRALLAKEAELNTSLSQAQQQLTAKSNGQSRIRENLKTLGHTEEEKRLRSRYVGQLEADETEIKSLEDEIRRANQALVATRNTFYKLSQEVTLERLFD